MTFNYGFFCIRIEANGGLYILQWINSDRYMISQHALAVMAFVHSQQGDDTWSTLVTEIFILVRLRVREICRHSLMHLILGLVPPIIRSNLCHTGSGVRLQNHRKAMSCMVQIAPDRVLLGRQKVLDFSRFRVFGFCCYDEKHRYLKAKRA